VLDEPSIGLHTRDTARLIHILEELRDLGNTILVVEHDADICARPIICSIWAGCGANSAASCWRGVLAEIEATSVVDRTLSEREDCDSCTHATP